MEYQEQLNARAAQNREAAESRELEHQVAENTRRVELRRQLRRKATRTLISRVLLCLALVTTLWLAMGFDLIHPILGVTLEALALAWATAWTGAWLQYIGKGFFK
jgi:hypothetical protein